MAQNKNNNNKKSLILEVKTKVCTKCKKQKTISEFHKNKYGKFGIRSICIVCNKPYYDGHKQKNKVHRILTSIKYRCYNSKNPAYLRYGGRGIKCLITEPELKELWFRDKAYNMKKPSIDR